jgi:hypothetical protein
VPDFKILGVLTLEDVIERVMRVDIIDENERDRNLTVANLTVDHEKANSTSDFER